MKSVLLHIGSTKTGTSSLQHYLTDHADALAEQGVLYPLSGRNAPGQIAHHNLCYEKQPGRIERGVFKPEVGVWSEALAEIDDGGVSVGIISSEAFMNCKPRQVRSFWEVLRDRDVRVIAYVRRQDKWLQSAWNQQARFGRCRLDFWEFYGDVRRRGRGDYSRMLEPWADAFGADRIAVRNFDAISTKGIVPDFFETFVPGVRLVELEEAGDPRRNTMAGVKQLVAVSRVLDICRGQLGPEFQLPVSSAIRIAEYFRDRPRESERFSILSHRDACELYESYRESNERLAEMSPGFGESGGFAEPQPEEFRNHVDLVELGDEIFDDDERRFVIRMAREVLRASGDGHRRPLLHRIAGRR